MHETLEELEYDTRIVFAKWIKSDTMEKDEKKGDTSI